MLDKIHEFEQTVADLRKQHAEAVEQNKKSKIFSKQDDFQIQRDLDSQLKRLDEFNSELAAKEADISTQDEVRLNELMLPVAQLGVGKYFGELALQHNKENPKKNVPRAATIRCTTQCRFATMSKADYQQILAKID